MQTARQPARPASLPASALRSSRERGQLTDRTGRKPSGGEVVVDRGAARDAAGLSRGVATAIFSGAAPRTSPPDHAQRTCRSAAVRADVRRLLPAAFAGLHHLCLARAAHRRIARRTCRRPLRIFAGRRCDRQWRSWPDAVRRQFHRQERRSSHRRGAARGAVARPSLPADRPHKAAPARGSRSGLATFRRSGWIRGHFRGRASGSGQGAGDCARARRRTAPGRSA